jgi:hypothetical protein
LKSLCPLVRTSAHLAFPQYFSAMRDLFDHALCHTFTNLKNMKAIHFAKGHKPILALFMDVGDLDYILTCLEKDIDPKPAMLAVCLRSSDIGKALFATLAKRMHYILYVEEIESQLNNLENLNFLTDEVRSFNELMQKEADALQGEAFNLFQKKKSKIFFLAAATYPVLSNANDEHVFRKAARMKSCAINAGDLVQLPWEAALFKPTELANVPQAVRVPCELLSEFANCRDAILKLCGPKPHNLFDLKKVIGSNLRNLQVLDRTVTLEYEYLTKEVEKLLVAKVHAAVLDALPTEANPTRVAQVLGGLK